MYYARFIEPNELDLLKSLFYSNPYSNGIRVPDETIDWQCQAMLEAVGKDNKKIAVSFNSDGEPFGFSVGHKKHNAAAWVQGLTLIKTPNPHGAKTAAQLAPAMDLLVEHMENCGYYKFWDISLQHKILELGKSLISRYATRLNRYDYFDEKIIGPGEQSGVKMWDDHRRIHPTEPVTVRLYVLRQEFRLQYLNPIK